MRQILAQTGWLTTAFLGAVLFLTAGSSAQAAAVYGVTTTNQLTRFDTATPGTVTTIGAITNLQTGENILGIDFRPANGQLYALGSTSRLYTINLLTGAATQIGAAGAFTLAGTNFGFDFNPVPDRIRVVSNTGQNLRLNPNDGTLTLADGTLNPGTPTVTAAAYTNNFAGTTTTTLYVIDTANDTLYIQNPPNAGTLVALGPLGVDASNVNGFDIASSNGTAYAALNVAGVSNLYTINLTSGAATLVGAFPVGSTVTGIATAFGTGANGTAVLDYDGDRRTDLAIYRSDTSSGQGTFIVQRSGDNGANFIPFGASSDIQTPGDYNGDGRTDYGVWRESNGRFYVLTTDTFAFQTLQFGQAGDEPVARDYNGDGRTDYAVVRRENGLMTWYVAPSGTNSFFGQQFGADTDAVAPGDYDGDGRFDLAVYRGNGNAQATFFVQQSTAGFNAVQFGAASDLVVPGDYDGDGKYDFAVVRAGTNYTWYILRSSNNQLQSRQLGNKPDLTVQGDYDGDGRTDVAVWNPITATYRIARSATNVVQQTPFGINSDFPIANFDTH